MDQMDRRTSESIGTSYFCMNGIGNCHLGPTNLKKALKPGGIGKKVGGSFKVGETATAPSTV